jgi:hypothetical protein
MKIRMIGEQADVKRMSWQKKIGYGETQNEGKYEGQEWTSRKLDKNRIEMEEIMKISRWTSRKLDKNMSKVKEIMEIRGELHEN